jgi:hypothetical protein
LQKKEVKEQFSAEGIKLVYMAGTVGPDEARALSKLVYRASRGKTLCYFDQQHFQVTDIDGNTHNRVVYMLVFQALDLLADRMDKI